jgi:hypothetical protein
MPRWPVEKEIFSRSIVWVAEIDKRYASVPTQLDNEVYSISLIQHSSRDESSKIKQTSLCTPIRRTRLISA